MSRKPSKTAGSESRILVVDDDERNLLALSEVLDPIADVVTVSSGKDALRLLLRQDFAVILLDVFMPGMDGYETAALIREREQTAKIPIIFLSAVNKETEHLMRGYEMGAVDYVFKPVDPLVLRSKVGVFVDLHAMRRQVEEQARAERDLRDAHYREQLSRLEAEQLLEKSEKRQAALLRSLPLAIYEDEQVGGQFERTIVGGDLTQLLGDQISSPVDRWRSFEESIHPDDRPAIVQPGGRPGDLVTSEYRWVGPDGSVHHILDQRIAIHADGEAPRWAGTLLDISERKRLEAQLVHVGKLDALGQLTGGVAHDFNNLLAAILGGLDILLRRTQFGDRELEIVGQMRHAAEQGAALVRRMMSFARQQDLNPASVDPASLCDSVAGLVGPTLGGTVTVNWHCPSQSLNLFVDRGQLELALMNLILNARDSMPGGGEIEVRIEPDSSRRLGKPAVRLRVVDHGCGIPANLLDKVTEPFFTTKEVGKGTGLGLSMVAGFVHQSGGCLSIDSQPGAGTTIEFLLPATRTEASADDSEPAGDGAAFAGGTILLIDDDDAVRVVLAEQFRDAGALVDDFTNGRDAIAAVRSDPHRHDFVVSDFAMPGLNGLQTLRKLKAVGSRARSILMTGHADDLRLKSDIEFPVLRKPTDLPSIWAALRME